MLKRLKVTNFKAWQEADISFGPVTGFFGTNGVGKSSLLQFLLLLKQTRNATDRGLVLDFGGPKNLVDLGTFRDVVSQHDDSRRMSWRLAWSLPEELEIQIPTSSAKGITIKDGTLEASCEVGLRRSRLRSHKLAYRFGRAEYRIDSQSENKNRFQLNSNDHRFKFMRIRGRAWPLSAPIKTHLFPDEVRYFYQNADFLADFEFAYEDFMDSIYYLGPRREYPRREYHRAGSSPEDVGQRGELTVDAILAATRDNEMRSLGYRMRRKRFQEMIAHWLRELGLIYDFRLEEIAEGTNLYRAMVKTSRSSVPTALTDVGFGVSQVLPALVLLYYVPEGSTVLMEQPEIHLHPSVQSGLADVILNVVSARDVQVIVESHSEHFLRRLQRRVAEGDSSSEDVRLYFVSRSGSKAQASDLCLNKWGEIENWPNNCFGDEMGEISAIARASLNRRADRSAPF